MTLTFSLESKPVETTPLFIDPQEDRSLHSISSAFTQQDTLRHPTATLRYAVLSFVHRHVLARRKSLRGELANIRGRRRGRHIPGSKDGAVRLTSAGRSSLAGAGKKSCDLADVPVSSRDAAPPWWNPVTRKEEGTISLSASRALSDPSTPAALHAGGVTERRATDPDIVQQHYERPRHGGRRALQPLLLHQPQSPQPQFEGAADARQNGVIAEFSQNPTLSRIEQQAPSRHDHSNRLPRNGFFRPMPILFGCNARKRQPG